MNEGADQIRERLERYQSALGRALENGLLKAGETLQRDSQERVPVNTGHLKASAFTRLDGAGLNSNVLVGYTADYALFVHEAVGMKLKGQPRARGTRPGGKGWRGRYWDPQGRAQPKFLEGPAYELRGTMFGIIQRELDRVRLL